MNESDGIKGFSQQATHSASSASVCLACVALSCILQWASLCRVGARHPPVQTPVLDILDSPSCDIFLVWTRWCHFLPGNSLYKCDVEGCSGSRSRELSRSPGRQVHKVMQRQHFQEQTRSALVYKMTAIIPSRSFQLCPILLYNQPHPHHPTPLWCAGEFHFLVGCAHLRPRLCNDEGASSLWFV